MSNIFKRDLKLDLLLKKKSHFLLGARGTGKSTLISQSFKKSEINYFDLLDNDTFDRLLRDPKILDQQNHKKITVIDEIQKLPKLLNQIHKNIFENQAKYLLTGSSARKIKNDQSNLLGGRAWESQLHPLTSFEIKDFDLLKYLNVGGLPSIYLSEYPQDELKNYSNLYLKEEILAEALTRNIEYFVSFLDIISLQNGEELHFQGLSNDSGVPARTIQNYIDVLETTLLGFQLKPFTKTKKRKAIKRSKFYLFDLGVTNYLAKRSDIKKGSELFGKVFEHFIIREVRSILSYQQSDLEMTYWRSTSQFEVDLIIGNEIAIEIKSSERINESHLKGLKAFSEEGLIKKYFLVSNDKNERIISGVQCLHWTSFLKLVRDKVS